MVSASNAQKTHLGRSLNQFAERKVAEAINQIGRGLPCSIVSVSGSIVTVKFEVAAQPFTLPNVTVPVASPEYMRVPYQAGDKGMVISADTLLSTLSGLGAGTPDLSIRANLSCLLFIPVSSKGWEAAESGSVFTLYGPDGVIVRSADKSVGLTVTKTENSWISPDAAPATIKGMFIVEGNLLIRGVIKSEAGGTYAGNIETTGDVIAKSGTAGSVGLATHSHTQGNDGHGDAEQPTAAPTGGT